MIKEHPLFVLLCILCLFVSGASVHKRGYELGHEKGYVEATKIMQERYKNIHNSVCE